MWRQNLHKEHEHFAQTVGSDKEEYALVMDTSFGHDLLYTNKRYCDIHNQQAPSGGEHAQLTSMMHDAGIPPQNPNTSNTDTASDEDGLNVDPDLGLADEAQPACPSADDSEEIDVLSLLCNQLRALFAQELVAPLERKRLINTYYENNGNCWICSLCCEFTHDSAATHVWGSCNKLEYHMKVHTPWHDLQLKMVSKGGHK
ncbi:hypothetical protein BDY19DRAFT_998162 [Irpex rosettiformis]|uniref:Uncharacterized protein n=1 Tax=Irpex rosettiformis TaxID=378272 RepID=A0ACB8TPI1_9APHY|nr:hypothetical protein BDY19DRAFT_998162 [Irpex rosettiformis]